MAAATDLMEMHILELSKLPPEEKNETSLLQWMRFLGGKTRKDFEEMAKKNSELEEAYDVLDKLSADEKKGTIEENIVKLQEKKMALADQIISGEEMGSGSFSKEELLKELYI